LLSVCPLSGAFAGLFAAEPARRAWVCVSEPSAAKSGLAARLGTLFGLTPAEQRVAAALLDGRSPADIAEAHDVSVATVRTQA
jgi:DNA-binding NarL/FixJ family response regulator